MPTYRRRGDNSDLYDDSTEGGNYQPTFQPPGAAPPANAGPAAKAPGPGATPPPAPGQISSWAGNTPQGVEDMWAQFLNSQGYGYGKQGAGQQYRGKLGDLSSKFNQLTGLHSNTVGDDKLDFGLGFGPQDVITGSGDWWLQHAPGYTGAAGGPGGGSGGGFGGGSGGYGGGAGAGSYSASGGSTPGNADFKSMFDQLSKLYPNGMFNQDVVNRRTENAAENLRRFQGSQRKNDEAYLADRGLIGSGPQHQANDLLEQNVANSYQNAVSGIYADEGQQADSRMMSALQTAAGLTGAQAQNALNWYKAQSDTGLGYAGLGLQRELGMGNLDLNRTLGTGGLALQNQRMGLDAQQLEWLMKHGDAQDLLDAIKTLYAGANNSSGGHR